jgi:hypothetical protein
MTRAWMAVLGAGLAAACGPASPDPGTEGAEGLPSSVSQVETAVAGTHVASPEHPDPAPWLPDTLRYSPKPGEHPEPAPWDEKSSAAVPSH